MSLSVPGGTVYGTLLNFQREWDLYQPQMAGTPYKAPPQAPVLYVKTANTLAVDGRIPLPPQVPQVELGASICMVFGSSELVKTSQSATEIVAFWLLMNDVSIPHASYYRPPVRFKCLDGFLGVGMQQVPAVELGDPASVKLDVHINGQLAQTVDFAQLRRPASALVRDVREFMSLRAGDALMLGLDCLPGGGRPLARVGDVVQISSPTHAALGVLTNTLVAGQ
jgi:5-oxopent-3-ene-1,2,5-tricarboxylate decarboxylase / 2-hydroxyhepta-2,4-diene-1,7-dioate isomerase